MTLKDQIKWLAAYCIKERKAGKDVTILRSILTRLRRLDKVEEPSEFHNAAMGVYKDFLRFHGLPAVVDNRQGRALKEILKKLKSVSKNKTEESAFESFRVILEHWQRVGSYLERRKQLSQINENLLEIIDKIKNGANKQASNALEADALHAEIAAKYR